MSTNISNKNIEIKSLSEVNPREINWLWINRIPFGGVTIIEGDGGIGKSFISISVASILSSGRALFGQNQFAPINVMLLSLEDDPEVVLRKRADANGGNCQKIFFLDKTFPLTNENINLLETKLAEKNIQLLFIDPIVGYFESGKDMNKGTDVRQLMNSLHQVAKKLNIAIVCIRHWNKSKDIKASSRGSGSVDFRNAARSVLSVAKGADGNSYLEVTKTNYSVPSTSLEFQIKDNILIWKGETFKTIDEVIAEQTNNTEEHISQLEEAVEFLEIELIGKRAKSSNIHKLARENGISETTLKRAKRKLGIKATKFSNEWFLSLPDCQEGQGGHDSKTDTLGPLDHLDILQLTERELKL